MFYQTVRLYLAPGVSEETVFGTKTKSEIRDWQWFPVDELPLSKKEAVRPNCLAIRNWNSFFMVMPFVRLVYTYMFTNFHSSKVVTVKGKPFIRSCSEIMYIQTLHPDFAEI